MADVKLNAGKGYGQVELNNVAFRRDGRIEAQCKLANGIDYVENGMILAVDNVTRTVGYPAATSKLFALHYSAEHIYDERTPGLKNFRLDKDTFLPRLGYLAVGDKFTTNTIVYDDALTLTAGQVGFVMAADNGYIRVDTAADGSAIGPVFEVIEVTTMPDGSPALKLQVVEC